MNIACILFDVSDGLPADWWKGHPLHVRYSEARRILLVLTRAQSLLSSRVTPDQRDIAGWNDRDTSSLTLELRDLR